LEVLGEAVLGNWLYFWEAEVAGDGRAGEYGAVE
jgi:hypothetical protein